MNTNYKAKTVKMQGFSGREEDVVPARERLLELKSSGTPYNVQTEPVEFMGKGFFKCLLTILLNPVQYFTGSSEIKNEVGGFEAAETRSIGRALAAYGIAIESNYASAEEFEKVQTQDPGATNSVKETLDQLAVVKERMAAQLDPNLGTQQEEPYAAFPEKVSTQPAKRTRNTAKTVVETKPEIEEAQIVDPNQLELPINKEEIVAEVAENPVIEEPKLIAQQQMPQAQEEDWFHKPAAKEEPKIIVIEAKPVVETPAGEQGNQFGIDIPELVDGARGFNIYIPVIMALEAKKDDMMADVSQAIVKLGLKDFISADKNTEHWELLLRTGSKSVVNSVLNTLGK